MSSFPNNPPWSTRALVWLCVLTTSFGLPAHLAAVTLTDLLEQPRLTAKKFASYFADFAYELNGPIQPADVFLSREKGDCDDYAVLADFVLRKHNLATRLIHIRLTGRVAHAVCYVTDNKAYLDYNNRAVFFTLTRCGPEIRDIAAKVADSLQSTWTTASEFSYSYETRRKLMIATISQTGEPVGNPSPGRPSPFNVD
ncbi:MAG TPA: transglutaminase domain-containing protein [Lacunisphaera sp.]|nr:transglutaminase domain-containing protein [Lacunisphaera sp.]